MSADTQIRQLRDDADEGAARVRCRAGEHWQEPVRLLGMAQAWVSAVMPVGDWLAGELDAAGWAAQESRYAPGQFLAAHVRSTCQCTAVTMDRWGPWDFKPLMDKLAQNPAQMVEGLELAQVYKREPQWPENGKWVTL